MFWKEKSGRSLPSLPQKTKARKMEQINPATKSNDKDVLGRKKNGRFLAANPAKDQDKIDGTKFKQTNPACKRVK